MTILSFPSNEETPSFPKGCFSENDFGEWAKTTKTEPHGWDSV